MRGELAEHRQVLAIGGADRVPFLQGLVTGDIHRLGQSLVYAALLTPQGKYLADFFLKEDGDRILLDVDAALAPDLIKRLTMYRLRADVVIDQTTLHVSRGLGEAPAGADADPRHPALGWRSYGAVAGSDPVIDWDAIRVAHVIPETDIELVPNETFILEAGFERLNGVDYKKGCYVGQEVTARMKHKTELRKGLAQVEVTGSAPVGTPITSDGKPAGTLFTQSGGKAIAYLRFGRAGPRMQAGEATVDWNG